MLDVSAMACSWPPRALAQISPSKHASKANLLPPVTELRDVS